jgi:hypothetical protein
MCELDGMADAPITVAALRVELDLTLEQFAAKLGLKSKGQAKAISDGGRCSVAVALRIEALSGGRIPAATLNPDIALIERVRKAA